MSLDKVKKYLSAFGLDGKIIEFSESTATVAQAAHALNTEPDRIAKTLSFLIDEKPIVIVMSGNSKTDNHKYKAAFNKKAKMISAADVERLTGHPVGGVCPFALNEDVDVYLDASLKKHSTVFPACGSRNSAIELTIAELENASKPKGWVDVAAEVKNGDNA